MNVIKGAYLMPHPPIIIPQIGKGEELKLYQTTISCLEIGEEIAKIKPDTIILISPHGPMFSDAIAISDEERISGSLHRFNCQQVNMDLKIDYPFNKELLRLCKEVEVPVVSVDKPLLKVFNRSYELDHGSVVPLYFINQYYKDYQLVHITYAPLKDRQLYQFGMKLREVATLLNRRVVVIASGDLSHKLSKSGPYPYSAYGEEFDRQLLLHLQVGEPLNIFELDSEMVIEAAECGLRSLKIMLGAFDGYRLKGELLSYQAPFGVGYATVKFNVQGQGIKALKYIGRSKSPKYPLIEKDNPYVRLARQALEDYFSDTKTMVERHELPDEMIANRCGVFVSLKQEGHLRGCIGTIFPLTDCVASEIVRNAIAAATEDPRFYPVTKDELKNLTFSVDVLSTPVAAIKEELNPQRYGVIVSLGERRGVLLPQLEGIETVEQQLAIACQKAGIDSDQPYDIEKFEVVRYKEGD